MLASPTVTGRVLALVARPFTVIRAIAARRRVVGYLAGFDDHMLRDIGLTRGDIQSALADPLFEDPTLRLSLRAREARSGRRATAREEMRWARMAGEAERHIEAEIDRRAA